MSDIEEESVSTHAAGSTKESVGPSEDRVVILKKQAKATQGTNHTCDQKNSQIYF